MHEQLAGVVTESVKETFWTMLMMKVSPEAPVRRESPMLLDGVSSVVTFSGRIRGAVSLHCPDPTAMKAAALLLRLPVTTISEEVLDTVGELTNMIAGATKRRLRQQESLFEIGLPVSKSGKGHSISPPATWPGTVLKFVSGDLAFEVILSLS